MISTGNASDRESALHNVLQKNKNAIAYKFDGSGCSCCRSSYFYLLCKSNNGYAYEMYCYHGNLTHDRDCALIRCSCNSSFTWENITPTKENLNEFLLKDMIESFIPITDKSWDFDYLTYLELEQENQKIKDMIDKDEKDNNMFYSCPTVKKNYYYYFDC